MNHLTPEGAVAAPTMTPLPAEAVATHPVLATGYQIGKISVAPGLVLAPMSGVTTSAFRRLIKELNPGAVGYTLSEFVSVEGLTRKARRTVEMLKFREVERPYAVQIFGYDPTRMADAAKIVQDIGADIVDINCGCPAPKVVRKGGGAELMRQPDHLKTIFSTVRKAVSIPVTMKMRSGWDANSLNCIDIARMAEGEGLASVTIHGRTRSQLYRGFADWSFVAAAADAVKIPVCGSGDVTNFTTAAERLNTAGVRGLYIGRAAIYHPYVFSEICGLPFPDLRRDGKMAVRILERYVDLLLEDFSPTNAIGKVKQLASQMARGHRWRKAILRAMSMQEAQDLLRRIREALDAGVEPDVGEEAGSASTPSSEAECSVDSCDAFQS